MNCLAGSNLLPGELPEGFLRGELTRASLCRQVDVESSAATGVERACDLEELSRRVVEATVGRGATPPRVSPGPTRSGRTPTRAEASRRRGRCSGVAVGGAALAQRRRAVWSLFPVCGRTATARRRGRTVRRGCGAVRRGCGAVRRGCGAVRRREGVRAGTATVWWWPCGPATVAVPGRPCGTSFGALRESEGACKVCKGWWA